MPATPVTTVVLRSEFGREMSSQSFNDPEKANRVMIARNRAEITLKTAWRWGIETEIPAAAPVEGEGGAK
jgi:hypothetical protein